MRNEYLLRGLKLDFEEEEEGAWREYETKIFADSDEEARSIVKRLHADIRRKQLYKLIKLVGE